MSSGEIVPVIIETAFGDIEIDIDAGSAPITAGNFLSHVDEGLYDGGRFHRTVSLENQQSLQAATLNADIAIEVIQGGIDPEKLPDTLQPIPLERTNVTGLLHLDGAISMARGGADTAVEGFFICIGDQPHSRRPGLRRLWLRHQRHGCGSHHPGATGRRSEPDSANPDQENRATLVRHKA